MADRHRGTDAALMDEELRGYISDAPFNPEYIEEPLRTVCGATITPFMQSNVLRPSSMPHLAYRHLVDVAASSTFHCDSFVCILLSMSVLQDFDSVLVIDGFPEVPAEKHEKLLTTVTGLLNKLSDNKILDIVMPQDPTTNGSKGYVHSW